jgi:lipopolysaccharide export system protein LptA
MRRLRRACAAVALAVACSAAPAAMAQDVPELLDISADELEVENRSCIFTWRGKAEATRGQTRLVADVLRAHLRPKPAAASGTAACGDILKIEAHGSVHYVTARGQRVRGDDGLYDPASGEITITGDVIAIDGQNVLRGARMTFNNDTGVGHVTGAPGGPAVRPRGVFYPESKTPGARPLSRTPNDPTGSSGSPTPSPAGDSKNGPS